MAIDDKKPVFFDKARAARIAAAVKRVEATPRNGPTPRAMGPRSVAQGLTYAKAPSGGIPARVGDQAGRADCELFYLNETGLLTSLGITTAVWNTFGSIVGAGSKRLVVGEVSQGWGVISEDC